MTAGLCGMFVAAAAHPRTSVGGPIPHASSMPMPRRQVFAGRDRAALTNSTCVLGLGVWRVGEVRTRKVDRFRDACEEMLQRHGATHGNNVKVVLRL